MQAEMGRCEAQANSSLTATSAALLSSRAGESQSGHLLSLPTTLFCHCLPWSSLSECVVGRASHALMPRASRRLSGRKRSWKEQRCLRMAEGRGRGSGRTAHHADEVIVVILGSLQGQLEIWYFVEVQAAEEPRALLAAWRSLGEQLRRTDDGINGKAPGETDGRGREGDRRKELATHHKKRK
eukprot:scaffold834_cov244-Pinguiococcus_pyrenoidosus.AAC.19